MPKALSFDAHTRKWALLAVFAALWSFKVTGGDLKSPAAANAPRDGQHDFDFEIGDWKTHVKRLQHPLSGSRTWVEYDGTSVVRGILGGRANVVELQITGPTGRIDGLSLRLYEPTTRQWSLNYASASDGHLTAPIIGGFRDGRGTFYGQDNLGGRAIIVRFVITMLSRDHLHFEQAFSADGGQSWETNWVADDTRDRS